MRMWHSHLRGALNHARWCHCDGLLLLSRDITLRIDEQGPEYNGSALLTIVAHPCAHLHHRLCRGGGRRLRIDSGGPIVHQIKVHLPGEDETHRTIQSAINEEVSRKRQHVGSRASQRGFRVVDHHRKHVRLSELECCRAVEAKARKATPM